MFYKYSASKIRSAIWSMNISDSDKLYLEDRIIDGKIYEELTDGRDPILLRMVLLLAHKLEEEEDIKGMTREEAVMMIAKKKRDHEENGHCVFFDEPDEMKALKMAFYALRDNPSVDCVLEIIDKHKTYHNGAHWTVLKEIRAEIEALKGEQG